MPDSIGDLLKDKSFQEPQEITLIKQYIQDEFDSDCSLLVRENQIIIQVSSAALAGTLRMHLPELQKIANTKKRLVLRIG